MGIATKLLVLVVTGLIIISPSIEAKPYSMRVQAKLKEMSVREKAGQMGQLSINKVVDLVLTSRVDKEKVRNYAKNYFIGSYLNSPTAGTGPAYNASTWLQMISDIQSVYVEEGITPMIFGLDSVHGAHFIYGATIFPQQINAGATFNPILGEEMAAVTAKDQRAVGVPWNFAPILDIAQHPAWARIFETFGEDPKLAAVMGAAFVRGYQGYPADLSRPDKVAACMKHFIGYGNPRTGKDRTTSVIPDRQLRQYHVPPFQATIDVGVATAMEGYNDINGEPLVASNKYLVKLLREEMGFEGMLVSDWATILDLERFHRVAPTVKDATFMSISRTSLDMSMIPSDEQFVDFLTELVEEGKIPESRLDESVARILDLKEKIGLLDNPMPDPNNPGLRTIGSREDRNVALNVARESIVLLENNGILPLNPSRLSRVFVVGPVSDSLTFLCGGWTIAHQGAITDRFFAFGVTILDGIRQIAAENPSLTIVHQTGFDIQGRYTQDELNAALLEANAADVTIVAFGEDHYAERLGDITELSLPAGQLEFVKALIATGKPVVAVLAQGRQRLLNGAVENAAAVLNAFLPGVEGGQAIAEIIFGQVNPSGKLPISYPRNDASVPLQYYRTVTSNADFQWEFGHGLSYSTFTYSNLQLSSMTITPSSPSIRVTVTITNEGPYDGKETVLFFFRDEYREVVPEAKLLFAFEKVLVSANDSVNVSVTLTLDDLSFYGIDDTKRVIEAGDYTLLVGPLSQTFALVV